MRVGEEGTDARRQGSCNVDLADEATVSRILACIANVPINRLEKLTSSTRTRTPVDPTDK